MLQASEDLQGGRACFSPKVILRSLVFGVVLVVVCMFSWRVFSFYRGIQTGEINPGLAYTTTDFSRAAHAFAAKAAANASGTPALIGVNDPTTGTTSPKIIIVEFGDFGCPYSKEVAPIVRAVAKQHSADIQLVFRDFPLDDLHPGATLAALGGGCAAEQGKFWEYHDAMFASNVELGLEEILAVGEGVGIETEAFRSCIESSYYGNAVAADIADGASLGVVGTPTFFFNGEKVEGSIPFNIFNQIVNAMLQT